MKKGTNENLNPEDYWKDTEKLLDNHFRKKRERKLLLLLLLLCFTSIGLYFVTNKRQATTNKMGTNSHARSVVITTKQRNINAPQLPFNSSNFNVSALEKTNTVKAKSSTGNLAVTNKTQEKKQVIQSALPFLLSTGLLVNQQSADGTTYHESVDQSTKEVQIRNNEMGISSQTIHNIELMPLLDLPHQTDNNTAIYHSFNETTVLKAKPRWDVMVYGTAQLVIKKTTGTLDNEYIERRNKEEHNVWMPSAGVKFSHPMNHWDVRIGLEFNVLGEKIKYSPYSKGEYYRNYQQWQSYEQTITDIDTTFIFGIPIYHTKLVTVTDSSLVDKTDTLNGMHYNSQMTEGNGITKHYLLEIPVEVVYQFTRGRWGAGIGAGLAGGILMGNKGYYLRNDETTIEAHDNTYTGDVLLNLRACAEVSYMINERIRLLLKPEAKWYLTSVKEKYGADKKYKSVAMSLGAIYTLK